MTRNVLSGRDHDPWKFPTLGVLDLQTKLDVPKPKFSTNKMHSLIKLFHVLKLLFHVFFVGSNIFDDDKDDQPHYHNGEHHEDTKHKRSNGTRN